MLCDSANKVAHTAHNKQTNVYTQDRKGEKGSYVTLNGKRCNEMNRGGRKEECGEQTIRKEIE